VAAKYDPRFLEAFAESLKRRAGWAIAVGSLLGFLIGAGLEAVLYRWIPGSMPSLDFSNPLLLVVPLFCVIPGCLYGSARATQLRVGAELLFCQLQIERNTREPASGVARTAASVGERVFGMTDAPVRARSASRPIETPARTPTPDDAGREPLRRKPGDVFGLR
jgi:hypothetical protein